MAYPHIAENLARTAPDGLVRSNGPVPLTSEMSEVAFTSGIPVDNNANYIYPDSPDAREFFDGEYAGLDYREVALTAREVFELALASNRDPGENWFKQIVSNDFERSPFRNFLMRQYLEEEKRAISVYSSTRRGGDSAWNVHSGRLVTSPHAYEFGALIQHNDGTNTRVAVSLPWQRSNPRLFGEEMTWHNMITPFSNPNSSRTKYKLPIFGSERYTDTRKEMIQEVMRAHQRYAYPVDLINRINGGRGTESPVIPLHDWWKAVTRLYAIPERQPGKESVHFADTVFSALMARSDERIFDRTNHKSIRGYVIQAIPVLTSQVLYKMIIDRNDWTALPERDGFR